MRVSNFTAGLLLTTALMSAGLMASTTGAFAHERKVNCACECPPAHSHHVAMRTPRMVRKVVRVVEESSSDYSYNYSANSPVAEPEWHGDWHVAQSDAPVPGPCCVAATVYPTPQVYYAPAAAPLYYAPAAEYGYVTGGDIGFTGGVGYGYAQGGYTGGGGGYGGGYGGAYFGGGVQNGPTYNSYGQSSQGGGVVAGPFQSRVMGGFAGTGR